MCLATDMDIALGMLSKVRLPVLLHTVPQKADFRQIPDLALMKVVKHAFVCVIALCWFASMPYNTFRPHVHM